MFTVVRVIITVGINTVLRIIIIVFDRSEEGDNKISVGLGLFRLLGLLGLIGLLIRVNNSTTTTTTTTTTTISDNNDHDNIN